MYYLIICSTPVTNGDSTYVYLQHPKLFVQNHGIYNIKYGGITGANIPQNIVMLTSFALLIYSDILAQLLSGWFLGVLAAVAVYCIARLFSKRRYAFYASFIFYTIPTLIPLIYGTKIDIGYTLFELCFWVLFAKWMIDRDEKYLYLSGVFLGFAIGSKYHALFALAFAAPIALIVLLKDRSPFGKIIRHLALFGILTLLIASPSYTKNYVYTQDPVYPFLTNPQAGAGEGINNYSIPRDYPLFLYHNALNKDPLFKPHSMMCNPFGLLPLLFLPLLFFQKGLDKRKGGVQIVFAFYFVLLSLVIFTSVFPYPRHYLPAIALIIALGAAGMQQLERIKIKNWQLASFLIIIIMAQSFYYGILPRGKRSFQRFKNQLEYHLGRLDKEEYLSSVLFNKGGHMDSEMIRYVKTMADDTVIMTLDFGNAYYVPRTFIKASYVYHIKDLDQLLQELHKDKVTHIYFSQEDMEAFVTSMFAGKHSIITQYLDTAVLEQEYSHGSQYLYRIHYDAQPSLTGLDTHVDLDADLSYARGF
ncbi:MAG: glycosyltransferase family 39 protein [Candidatus Cloacimonadaceae bacterium]